MSYRLTYVYILELQIVYTFFDFQRIISFGFLFLMTYTLANGLGYDGTRWVKISSSREGKSLRNTFPFSETAHHGHHDEHHHDHHHHHEESGSLNSKHHNAGFSLPGTSFSPPALGI